MHFLCREKVCVCGASHSPLVKNFFFSSIYVIIRIITSIVDLILLSQSVGLLKPIVTSTHINLHLHLRSPFPYAPSFTINMLRISFCCSSAPYSVSFLFWLVVIFGCISRSVVVLYHTFIVLRLQHLSPICMNLLSFYCFPYFIHTQMLLSKLEHFLLICWMMR